MERCTIADAVRNLETLLQVLDNTYWEVSNISHKDVIYDFISIIHIEINELAKLSVDDHYMAYEPITVAFRNCQTKLKMLQNNMELWVNRSATAKILDEELATVTALLNQQR